MTRVDDAQCLCPAILADNTMRDTALQRELFELYFAQSGQYLASMREGAAQGDHTAWRIGSHSLKGTAQSLGLMRLAAASARAEAAGPKAGLPAIEAIEDALVEARAAAAAYLAQTAASAA